MAAKKGPKRNPLAGVGQAREKPEPPSRYTETLGSGRKRRKDATGRKKDYHKGTTTLATRVPEALARAARQEAKAAGLSMNAWLAQLIEAALTD